MTNKDTDSGRAGSGFAGTKMEKIISFCKRRSFIFQSAEIYGGLQGFWDFGPLGVELKNNIKRAWWKKFVQQRDDIVGLDSAIITNPTVWEKSGHLGKFKDFLIECGSCHRRYKIEDVLPDNLLKKIPEFGKQQEPLLNVDPEGVKTNFKKFFNKLLDELNEGKTAICPNCSSKKWSNLDSFFTMLETFVGSSATEGVKVFLRPETAQNIFVNFELIRQTMRQKIPFGIAQIGKAFRNEITPGNFIFRSREFEQMELEYFVKPKDDKKYFKEWVEASYQWFIDLGIKKENLRKYEQAGKELAHYAKQTIDIEYRFPFSSKGPLRPRGEASGSASGGDKGFAELMGISNRTDYDLKAHGFEYKDEANPKPFVPFVIEPSAGVDRAMLAFLIDAYEEVEGGRTTTTESNKDQEVVLRLHKDLAPYKVAILPLSKKEEVSGPAKEIYNNLQKYFMVAYDDAASIGRRYRRQDEIGTPYCITYDFDSNKDKRVTVRDRDTMEQERIAIDELVDYLKEKYEV